MNEVTRPLMHILCYFVFCLYFVQILAKAQQAQNIYLSWLHQYQKAICWKWPGLLWAGIFFLHYNTGPHRAKGARVSIWKYRTIHLTAFAIIILYRFETPVAASCTVPPISSMVPIWNTVECLHSKVDRTSTYLRYVSLYYISIDCQVGSSYDWNHTIILLYPYVSLNQGLL